MPSKSHLPSVARPRAHLVSLTTTPLAALLVLVLAGCGAPHSEAPPELPSALAVQTLTVLELPGTTNVHTVAGVITAGQPSVAGFEAARELGVKSVLNNRKPAEMKGLGFDERATVEALGMEYIELPWNGVEELTDVMLDRSRQILREAPRPTLFHCGSANRVGAAWIAWRVLDEGVDVEEAVKEAQTIGLRTPTYEPRVREYVAARQSARRN